MKTRPQNGRIESPIANLSLLVILYEAMEAALREECSPWQFATEVQYLLSNDVTIQNVRDLIAQDLAENAIEITRPQDRSRRFRRVQSLAIPEKTCLILTPLGIKVAAKFKADSNLAQTSSVPVWDSKRRILFAGSKVVKQFKVLAANQEAILAVFQEEGWPVRIDDPLPPEHDLDRKQRLLETIKSLNRSQVRRLVRFRGDGTGNGISWEWYRLTVRGRHDARRRMS